MYCIERSLSPVRQMWLTFRKGPSALSGWMLALTLMSFCMYQTGTWRNECEVVVFILKPVLFSLYKFSRLTPEVLNPFLAPLLFHLYIVEGKTLFIPLFSPALVKISLTNVVHIVISLLVKGFFFFFILTCKIVWYTVRDENKEEVRSLPLMDSWMLQCDPPAWRRDHGGHLYEIILSVCFHMFLGNQVESVALLWKEKKKKHQRGACRTWSAICKDS